MAIITTVNPATGIAGKAYPAHDDAQIINAIECAHAAFQLWKHTSFPGRAAVLLRAADMLEQQKEMLAELMTEEMGKLTHEGISEIEKCAMGCRYYAEFGATYLADEPVQTEAAKSYITYQPLGVVLAVMPWNFPFWQVFRFAAPALMAGNAALLKHASNTPGCALAIQDIFTQAGAPQHLFTSLLIESDKVAEVIAHPLVRAVTLTGSTPAGKAVAEAAGKHLKKTVLELGGSDAYIVLADADLPQAAKMCAQSRMINGGQSCIAAKRFIVVKEVMAKFQALFLEEMKKFDYGTTQPPLARADLRDALHEQVTDSVAKGARVLLGGKLPKGNGAYYPATVLANVLPGMRAYEEELFGPVAALITAADENDGLHIANSTSFGLGAAVFTSDREKGNLIARELLEAGSCFVNAFVKSDPRLPFGGIKESGYGRELSYAGIREFVNCKTVWVA